MRKPNTKTVRGKGKLQDQQVTIGLDLGDRSSFYCVLNGACEVILEERVANRLCLNISVGYGDLSDSADP
jgi:transposase